MNNFIYALCTALLPALLAAPAHAAPAHESAPSVQVFLGVLELDNQTATLHDSSRDSVDVDFSSLPSGGIEAEYLLAGGWVHWGLNPGGSVSWKNDDTKFAGSLTNENGGTLVVEADNSLLLVELHLGGYVRGRVTDRITTYAAAGPMLMYGSHDVNNEDVREVPTQHANNSTVVFNETDSSDLNIGYYARAGVDFEIGGNQQLGLGVRYMSTELDFDKTVGNLDIKGPQYVLTYTIRL